MALRREETLQLRASLQDAVVKCSERCLYQAAKWCVAVLQQQMQVVSTR